MKIALAPVLLMVLLFFSAHDLSAQKLPRIQEGNVLVPANSIRVDGRLEEWGKPAAHNKAFGIYYTIANDDRNLYLSIRSENESTARKIIVGGLSFTVSQPEREAGEIHSAVTFPYYDRNTPAWHIDLGTGAKGADSGAANNRTIAGKFRTIGVRGFRSVADSVISIYNEEGIKAAARFDETISYCYELAIPLKLLNVPNNGAKLTYNIRLNGIPIHGTNLKLQTFGRDIITYTAYDGSNVQVGQATPEMIALVLPTDFSGQYTVVFR